MSVGGKPVWSLNQVAAAALAALQVCVETVYPIPTLYTVQDIALKLLIIGNMIVRVLVPLPASHGGFSYVAMGGIQPCSESLLIV